jgi:hypothetical protein
MSYNKWLDDSDERGIYTAEEEDAYNARVARERAEQAAEDAAIEAAADRRGPFYIAADERVADDDGGEW